MIKIQFALRKEHAQTFAQITPSANFPFIWSVWGLPHHFISSRYEPGNVETAGIIMFSGNDAQAAKFN